MNALPDGTTIPARELPGTDAGQRASGTVSIADQADFEEALRWLPELSSIALHFSTFTDGRAFSWARLLRERYGFAGELVATGHVLPDQHQMLEACGVATDSAAGDAELPALPRFTVSYPH